MKDVLRAVASESTGTEEAARDLMRDVLTIPENRRIDDILEDLRRQDLQMAVVIDEWGSFEGVFTLEDIIEEIVGEIRDEFDEEEPAVKELGDGSYLTKGRVSIGEVNEALGTEFESQDFETVGGLVLGHLGRVPEKGDEARIDGYLLRVDETDGPASPKSSSASPMKSRRPTARGNTESGQTATPLCKGLPLSLPVDPRSPLSRGQASRE
jgi:CBS domain containing-hemolysin-like protein